MSALTSDEIQARYQRAGYEHEAFDSMPETPDMGYLYSAHTVHGPRYGWYVELVHTRAKIDSDYYRDDPHTLKLTIKLGQHQLQLGGSKRQFWIQRQAHSADGTPYIMQSLPPQQFSQEMDRRREAQRRWLEAYRPRPVPVGTTDLAHHAVHGAFDDYGYAFTAYEPQDDQAERVLVLTLRPLDDKLVQHEIVMPMTQPNLFGLDVDDARTLDETTDRVVQELLNPQHARELVVPNGALLAREED